MPRDGHVHVSALTGVTFAFYLIIVGFIFRVIETTWPDSQIAKALAFVH